MGNYGGWELGISYRGTYFRGLACSLACKQPALEHESGYHVILFPASHWPRHDLDAWNAWNHHLFRRYVSAHPELGNLQGVHLKRGGTERKVSAEGGSSTNALRFPQLSSFCSCFHADRKPMLDLELDAHVGIKSHRVQSLAGRTNPDAGEGSRVQLGCNWLCRHPRALPAVASLLPCNVYKCSQ